MRNVFVAVCYLLSVCEAARILAVLPCPSRSHHIWNRVLLEALATRGHQVLALTPFVETDKPNLRYVFLDDNSNAITQLKSTVLDRANLSARQNADKFFQCCFDFCRNILKSDGSKHVLAMKGDFDLLLIETLGFESMFGFIYHFDLPTIAITAHGHTPWTCRQMQIPEQTAVLPLEGLTYSMPMTFFQRLYNTWLTLYMQIRRQVEYLPRHDAIAREVFGPDMPPLSELEKTFDMFLVNSVPVLDPPRPLPPNVIEVGCLHCGPGKSLQADIQKFLDDATEGAIYFSLGSNVLSDFLPDATIKALLTVFSELPQRVLWKWEFEDKMQRRPANVLLAKWLSQQDVLAHPNVHVFMTHGGRLSILEGLYHGVPMLVMPVYFDQYLHAHRVQDLDIGVRLDINNVTALGLRHALKTLLESNRFRDSARHVSSLIRDQPESPLERAVFWIEYVLRHKGTPHLRSAANHLAWYQLHLLDVAAILVLVPFTIVILVGFALRRRSRKRDNVDKEKQL